MAAADYWDIVGETFLPPNSTIPSLKERAAWVAAGSIDRAPEVTIFLFFFLWRWWEGVCFDLFGGSYRCPFLWLVL